MSLINDALKKAKQAQPPPMTPAAGPQLRPAEPALNPRHGVGYLLPASLALIALCGLFLVWQLRQRSHGSAAAAVSSELEVRAIAADPAPPKISPGSTPVPVPAAPATPPAPAVVPPTRAAQNVPAADAAEASTSGLAANTAPAVVVEPPKSIPLRLQGVVMHPSRPSALINGKTVFIGDRVGNLRVTRITSDTVTLSGNGKTNVIALEGNL